MKSIFGFIDVHAEKSLFTKLMYKLMQILLYIWRLIIF